ncbi:MAG: MutS-related protein [Acidimicrobiales bacterium]
MANETGRDDIRASPPAFRSILFLGPRGPGGARPEEPAYFMDLHLDQVVGDITAGRDDYDLKPLFYEPLHDVEAIRYRQDVTADVQEQAIFEVLARFARSMRDMRDQLALAGKLHYERQRQRWFLEAVGTYSDGVRRLARDLAAAELSSLGLLGFRDYLGSYVESVPFASLVAETSRLVEDLSRLTYCVHIKGSRVTVSRYGSEADYSAEVLQTFERFKQDAARDYRVGFSALPEMDHVEARVLDLVARLFDEQFTALEDYCDRHRDYLDRTVGNFDREAQFYLSYAEHIQRFQRAGLDFCYPTVSTRSKDVSAEATFDLALAGKLVPGGSPVVRNDFHLAGTERVFVVSGPNQGGKTTFARTFGQLHHLASLGCPVPGTSAHLFAFDRLFTHFERQEDPLQDRGKLEDDLVRVGEIFRLATSDSIVIMNEVFTSTTLSDATFLGKKVLGKIVELGLLCVYVTFIDELASLAEPIVSMMSTVNPDDPAERTYKVVRKPADGRAYAVALARKHGLTYEKLTERIARRGPAPSGAPRTEGARRQGAGSGRSR